MIDPADEIDVARFIDAELADAGLPELFIDAPSADVEHDGWLATGVEPMDCRNKAGLRPCPFVACAHHLLLDAIATERDEPNLAISRARLPMFPPAPGESQRGRRRELAPTVPLGSSEDAAFQRRALERLWELPETCGREVAMRGAADVRAIARVMGAEEDEVGSDLDDALCILRGAALAAGWAPEDGFDALLGYARLLGIEMT